MKIIIFLLLSISLNAELVCVYRKGCNSRYVETIKEVAKVKTNYLKLHFSPQDSITLQVKSIKAIDCKTVSYVLTNGEYKKISVYAYVTWSE